MSLVTVGTFTSPWNAHIAKGRLEAEGITAQIANEYHIWMTWPLSQALGGVKVQVSHDDEEQALMIISSHLNGDYSEDLTKEDLEVDDNVCPNCGSGKYKSRLPMSKILLVIITLGLAVIFPIRANKHKCINCSQEWTY